MDGWEENDRSALQTLMAITPAQTIAVLNHLGIADLLQEGRRGVDELANASGAHTLTLYRLLRFAASHGVFTEVESRVFANTPMSSWLRRDAPRSLWWRVEGDILVKPWLPWQEWIATTMTGEAAYDRMHGRSFWAAIAENEASRAALDGNVRAAAELQMPAVLPLLDFADRHHVVDVGAGWAGWLAAILHDHPHLTGVAFDLPEAAHVATTTLESAGVSKRSAFVAGDFFESVPRGDVMLLANVLHDWDDARAIAILRCCRDALEPGGVIVGVDRVLPEGDVPHPGKAVDINMLFLLGGRERTVRECDELFAAAGLVVERIVEASSDVSVLTAVAGTEGVT
ncbi:MAG: hypothetical protein QOF21_1083 [Actinomycetota bacterium]|jgi:predicted O-methyltransferase YrrM